jgi:hypothetical protein
MSVSRYVLRYSRRSAHGARPRPSSASGRPLIALIRIGTIGTRCSTGWPPARTIESTAAS